jgi:hypothetical protein
MNPKPIPLLEADHMKFRHISLALAFAMLGSQLSLAQSGSTPAMPATKISSIPHGTWEASSQLCPSGVRMVLRINEVKEGSTVEKYLAAVAAQAAWYKSHDLKDVIYSTPQIVNEDGKAKLSNHIFISYHYGLINSPETKPDAEWDAYVKLYVESSIVKEIVLQCIPKEYAPVQLFQ